MYVFLTSTHNRKDVHTVLCEEAKECSSQACQSLTDDKRSQEMRGARWYGTRQSCCTGALAKPRNRPRVAWWLQPVVVCVIVCIHVCVLEGGAPGQPSQEVAQGSNGPRGSPSSTPGSTTRTPPRFTRLLLPAAGGGSSAERISVVPQQAGGINPWWWHVSQSHICKHRR
jgi:hypothetical protein